MKHRKIFLSFLLALAMVVGLMPGMGLTAYAAPTETLLATITGAGSNANPATSANVSYSTEGVATLTFSGSVVYQASLAWGYIMGLSRPCPCAPADRLRRGRRQGRAVRGGYTKQRRKHRHTAVNGITVTRNDFTQITVSGTPTADAAIALTAPTAKTTPATPTTAAAVDCTTADNNDGKLTGVTADMEYRKSDATEWTAGTGSDITGLVPGTYYVRVKATDTTLASDNRVQPQS